MITEIIRDRIIKASAEISNARDAVRHVLNTIAEIPEKLHPNTVAAAPVNPHGLSLSRAVDLLESEINALQRELVEFRGDEPQEATAAEPRRYK